MPAGYSGTPLVKKLGIKPGFKIRLVNPPDHYFELLGTLPEDLLFLEDNSQLADFVHLFCPDRAFFESQITLLADEMERNGMIWVSWYKKSAKIPTDLNENIIRDTVLQMGLVDVKVCAVDEKWSGLKVVIRKENR
ncbi:MAG: DUF3052 domain-containing protein [Bacteroidota bacterium]